MTTRNHMVCMIMSNTPVVAEDQLSLEMFQKALPKHVKKHLNQEIIDGVNVVLRDPAMRESYRDNLLSYTSVMSEGKFKIGSYVDAVRYVSCKLLGASNLQAYLTTFPVRYQELLNKGIEERHIASIVSAYNKGVLVNKIFEQTLVPLGVLNADLAQRALNVMADLMISAKSEKVRGDAANNLVNHLKMPETTKIELDIGIKEDNSISELRETTLELVAQQRKMIESGALDAKQVAHSKVIGKIIEGEVIKSGNNA